MKKQFRGASWCLLDWEPFLLPTLASSSPGKSDSKTRIEVVCIHVFSQSSNVDIIVNFFNWVREIGFLISHPWRSYLLEIPKNLYLAYSIFNVSSLEL
jgi:hypothetical protein